MNLPAGLVAFAKKESNRLYLGDRTDEDPFGDSDFSYVEHLMHEVAHALLLNIPIEPGISTAIASEITSTNGVWQETMAWGVEWQAAKTIGVPLEIEDVLDAASIQGCEDQNVRDALEDPDLEPYVQQLVDYMTMGGRLR